MKHVVPPTPSPPPEHFRYLTATIAVCTAATYAVACPLCSALPGVPCAVPESACTEGMPIPAHLDRIEAARNRTV